MSIMSFDFQARSVAFWVSLAITSIYAIRTLRRRNTQRLPPGPRGLPWLGTQLSKQPWLDFENFHKQHGPVVYFTAAGQGYLVLNTQKVTCDLLDRRFDIYSDRPRFILADEIFTGGLVVAFSRYGDTWRRLRRASHEGLHKVRVTQYQPIQSREAVLLVEGLLETTKDLELQFRRVAGSAMLSAIYDLPPALTINDPAIRKANDFNAAGIKYARPGNYLVETFPWMKYLPSSIAPWKKEAEEGFKDYSNFFESMYNEVKDRINQGDERPSFTGDLVRDPQRHRMTDLEAAWQAATMYSAGAETTGITLLWFILAMILHPEKQRKCQEELDNVVGRSRMPTFKDQDSLPYLRATLRELLRWGTVGPIGIQHYSTQDDVYEGYFIPKGTVCISNIWSIHRDSALYGEDAREFNPDRFIDEKGDVFPPLGDTRSGHMAYGFGPRICAGRYMANNGIFINIASMLWATNISPAKDEAGKSIIPDPSDTIFYGSALGPAPFDCVISPRFPEVATLIAQTKELM